MFDLERLALPRIVEAHGGRWLACYRVSSSDTHHSYIAVPAADGADTSLPLPQPCTLIAVPLTEPELEGVARRKERHAAEDARWATQMEARRAAAQKKDEEEKKDG